MGPNEMIRNLLRIEGDFDFFPELALLGLVGKMYSKIHFS